MKEIRYRYFDMLAGPQGDGGGDRNRLKKKTLSENGKGTDSGEKQSRRGNGVSRGGLFCRAAMQMKAALQQC